jgi:LDH2 family malate/lactate/ureidoglycolate dehydrogenase
MIVANVEGLRRFAEKSLKKVGLGERDAALVSDVLVDADLRGVHSHGLHNLPRWARGFLKGHLATDVTLPIVVDGGSTCVIDGQNSLGVLASKKAMDIAIERAKKYGVGIVGVRNSSHFGPAAYFTMQALAHDQIGFCATNGPTVMAPWGGREPLLSNNPFSYAVPSGSEVPIVLDMACSVSARGRIRMMARENQPIPEGWALNSEGEPTTDGREALEGSVMPVGGYKGYGIAVVNEILSAALTGALFSFEVGSINKGNASDEIQSHEQTAWGCGHFFGAFDISRFTTVEEFKKRVDYFSRTLKESPKAKGVDRIYLPGEIEHELRTERLVSGIPLPSSTIELLDSFAKNEIGIEPLEFFCELNYLSKDR